MKSLMLNGMGFVSGDPGLKLSYPFVAHSGLQIKATITGDLKWISMMLPLSKGDVITGVKISYKCSAATSFISQIRISEQASVATAIVRHDDGTDLKAVTPATANSPVAKVPVNGSMVLDLRLFFANIADIIEIGAVEIIYQ